MPAVTRVNHIGIPVSDLERSVKWYEEVLSITADGVTAEASGEAIGNVLELDHPTLRAVFALAGDNVQVELLQYEHPVPKPFEARNCDVGAIHLCFEVDDIEVAHRELVDQDVHINSGPLEIGAGPDVDSGGLAGVKVLYFRDPDGVQLEFFELPKSA